MKRKHVGIILLAWLIIAPLLVKAYGINGNFDFNEKVAVWDPTYSRQLTREDNVHKQNVSPDLETMFAPTVIHVLQKKTDVQTDNESISSGGLGEDHRTKWTSDEKKLRSRILLVFSAVYFISTTALYIVARKRTRIRND
ncbi:MAG: hypothetical protein ACOX1Q_01780 [Eubacteriales bacterium]